MHKPRHHLEKSESPPPKDEEATGESNGLDKNIIESSGVHGGFLVMEPILIYIYASNSKPRQLREILYLIPPNPLCPPETIILSLEHVSLFTLLSK